MEITYNSGYYSIPLVVGRRIAQIVFFDTDGTLNQRSYATTAGKYQNTEDLEKLMNEWKPETCLPRLFLDREIQDGPAVDPLLAPSVSSPALKTNPLVAPPSDKKS